MNSLMEMVWSTVKMLTQRGENIVNAMDFIGNNRYDLIETNFRTYLLTWQEEVPEDGSLLLDTGTYANFTVEHPAGWIIFNWKGSDKLYYIATRWLNTYAVDRDLEKLIAIRSLKLLEPISLI